MATTACRDYSPIPADPEKLDRLVNEFAGVCGIEPAQVAVSVSYQFDDGGRDIRTIEPSAISALVPIGRPIELIALGGQKPGYPRLHIFVREDHVGINAAADTMSLAKEMVDRTVACLGLAPYTPPTEHQVAALEKRLDAVQALQEQDVRLRCFLSFRFNATDEALAIQLERFLRLQRVEVLTGRSYEPRRVEDKVQTLLAQALDFVVYLLTSSGDSAWVRDEIAQARAARITVIPLVEEGVTFEPGLFGNVERISFAAGHIGDVWVSLAEALEFIRATRRRATASRDESVSQ